MEDAAQNSAHPAAWPFLFLFANKDGEKETCCLFSISEMLRKYGGRIPGKRSQLLAFAFSFAYGLFRPGLFDRVRPA